MKKKEEKEILEEDS